MTNGGALDHATGAAAPKGEPESTLHMTGGAASQDADGAIADSNLSRYQSTEQIFTCTVCRKVFKREMNLIFHMTTHRPRQPQAEPLEVTMTTPVNCQDCGKAFATKYQAKKHYLRRHFSGDKPFSCNKCGKKKFVVKEDLTMHMKSCGHVYLCKCGIRLCSLGALKRHCKYFQHEPRSYDPVGEATHDRYGTQVAEARQLDTLTGSLRPHEDYACSQHLSGGTTLGVGGALCSILHGSRGGEGSVGAYDPHTAGHFAGSFSSAIGIMNGEPVGMRVANEQTLPGAMPACLFQALRQAQAEQQTMVGLGIMPAQSAAHWPRPNQDHERISAYLEAAGARLFLSNTESAAAPSKHVSIDNYCGARLSGVASKTPSLHVTTARVGQQVFDPHTYSVADGSRNDVVEEYDGSVITNSTATRIVERLTAGRRCSHYCSSSSPAACASSEPTTMCRESVDLLLPLDERHPGRGSTYKRSGNHGGV